MSILLILIIAVSSYSICERTKLVLVRHGESEWSKLNLFTGWTDVPLSIKGHEEAIQGGKLLKEGGYKFDICYTSILKRAIQTAYYVLHELDQLHIPVLKDFHLNERHYGALQGLNKKETTQKYGSEQVKAWRKSFDIPPPALEEKDERNPANQEKYKSTHKKELPLHESLKDTISRVIPYYNDVILPDIRAGKKVLISAHGNSIKALVKYLDNISDQEIVDLNILTGIPLVYELDKDLKPIKHYYLGDQETVKAKINAIKNKESKTNINIIIVDKLTEEHEKDVWEIMKESDKDFIPPLSARVDTTHKFYSEKSFKNEKQEGGPIKYFEEIKKENFVLVLKNGKVEGFMSFIKDYPLSIDEEIVICDYITTIIINSKSRNKGYTKKMYDKILNERKQRKMATRTWSLNNSHMHILDKLGFKLVKRDKDDRGVNIDTVYYLRIPTKDE